MGVRRRPRRLGPEMGVRRRITLSACIAVIVPLLMTIAVVAVMLHQMLQRALVDRLATDARQVGGQVARGGPRQVDPLYLGPDSHGVSVRVDSRTGVQEFSWPRGAAPSGRWSDPGRIVVDGVGLAPAPDMDEPPVTAAIVAVHDGEPYLVSVSASQADQHEAVETAVGILAAGTPLFILLTALGTWLAVGRALRPVDEMRAAAERISTQELASRLPTSRHDDELGRLARTLNDMLGRLQAGRDAQRQFVADASHEMRSPLTSLRASIQLGRASGTAERWNDLAEVMDVESLRLQRLVEDLLTLSKADERGGLPLTLEDVDLDDIALSELTRLRSRGLTAGGDVHAARVTGDRLQLARVVRNLVDNAVRASATQVRIGVRGTDGIAHIVVEDDGPGIPQDQRERVFQRFVRLDEARRRDSGGSGLGLPIVAEIVRAHGGHVRVGSSRLGGALLDVALPVAEDPGLRPSDDPE